MRWRLLLFIPLLAAYWLVPALCPAQSESVPYTLRIPVDEIALTFHASDAHGKPLRHLLPQDITLLDNGAPPSQILAIQEFQNLSIHAGFLFDISASMLKEIDFNSSIISTYASQLLLPRFDRAFVAQFDTEPLITQDWTDNHWLITSGANAVGPRSSRYAPLTAIFDSLYITCRDQWTADRGEATGNFILLFTDGIDDASHVYLSEAVDMCQRSHTAIYAIVNHRKSSSEGNQTLINLAQQTGGRVFFKLRGKEILQALQTIEAEQRNQYRLVYKPSNFNADGSFHRIQLSSPLKDANIVTRSGYYAFPRK